MGLFDGGLFDFTGDGKTSFEEEISGFLILSELLREDKADRHRTHRPRAAPPVAVDEVEGEEDECDDKDGEGNF